jgi:hypothetical protein
LSFSALTPGGASSSAGTFSQAIPLSTIATARV